MLYRVVPVFVHVHLLWYWVQVLGSRAIKADIGDSCRLYLEVISVIRHVRSGDNEKYNNYYTKIILSITVHNGVRLGGIISPK